MIIVYKLPGVIIATHIPSIKAKSQSRYNPLGKQTLGLAETRRRFQGAPRSVVGSFESAGRLKTGGICAARGERGCRRATAPRATLHEKLRYCRTFFFRRRQLFFVAHSVLRSPGIISLLPFHGLLDGNGSSSVIPPPSDRVRADCSESLTKTIKKS